jgi:hypothetical protein
MGGVSEVALGGCGCRRLHDHRGVDDQRLGNVLYTGRHASIDTLRNPGECDH